MSIAKCFHPDPSHINQSAAGSEEYFTAHCQTSSLQASLMSYVCSAVLTSE